MSTQKNAFFLDSSVELTKTDVEELRIGMYVSMLDRPWEETNFLFQGFVLETQDDIDAIFEQCEYVYIDVTKQRLISQSTAVRKITSGDVNNAARTRKSTTAHVTKATFEYRKSGDWRENLKKTIVHFNRPYKQVSTVVKSFMQEVSVGQSINVALAKEVVASIVDDIVQVPDAFMWLTQLKTRDEYTAQHSMNVAVFAIALGRQLGLSVTELNNVGLCGMMHDMGKMRIPLEVLNKPERLTFEESIIMNSHSKLGWELLMSSSNMYPGAIESAYSHHEKLDGTGYPRRLKADKISTYTRIVTIVDMYDAITSDRVYKKGRSHLEATSIMTKSGGTHLDLDLTVKFIECLGIYPPGNLLEMTNGEVAVVLETNQNAKLRPKVMFVLDANKQPRPSRLVDLSQACVDKKGEPYKIKKMLMQGEYNVDLNGIYEAYLRLGR